MFKLTLPTPLHRLHELSKLWNVNLWIKRDDLIPQYMGGNKVRKNNILLSAHIRKNGIPDILITAGGQQSNHARVIALMGAHLGCKVELVLHGSATKKTGNALISKLAGAKAHNTSVENVAKKIHELEQHYLKGNKKVLVVPGGAHTKEASNAYADAIEELPFEPDYIVHASGTGGTQAGLIKGVRTKNHDTHVIGISVARNYDRGIQAIQELLTEQNQSNENIIFSDKFTFGGYGKTNPELNNFIKKIICLEGIPLDPTYTGKAMFGLYKLIEKGTIKRNSNVIFWHTGGLLSLLS